MISPDRESQACSGRLLIATSFGSLLLIHLHEKHQEIMWHFPRNFVASLKTRRDVSLHDPMQRYRLIDSALLMLAIYHCRVPDLAGLP